jgi:hypothetical protein
VSYALALAITLAVEVPSYVGVLAFADLLPGWRRWLGAVGVNVATHPLVWLVLSAHPGWLWPVEASVCVVEALLLWLFAGLAARRSVGLPAVWRLDLRLLLLAALVANTGSVLAGFVVQSVLYGPTS